MPELAEVEMARRSMARFLSKKITLTNASEQGGHARDGQFDDLVIEKCSQKDFEKALTGRTLVETGRRGKTMWWRFDQPSLTLGLQLVLL